jgi:hypothetical protein
MRYPLFVIKLDQGFADRHSLPLEYVIRTLQEVKAMLEIAGKRLERAHGSEHPKGALGLELVAGFQKGSVQANLRSTLNEGIFIEAAEEVVQTVQSLGDQPRRAGIAPTPVDIDPRIIRRLSNIGKIQEINKTRMELTLRHGVQKSTAMFDEAAARKAAAFRDPTFSLEDVTLFGKLRELKDKSDEDEDIKAFFGELVSDDGLVWRLQFAAHDAERAAHLFRQQIYVIGRAHHYRAVAPKVIVTQFGADEERDYEAAFDRLYGLKREAYKAGLQELLEELRGEG